MMLPNDLPPYLQDALEHATFEQLDLNADGILSADELAVFKQSVAHRASEIIPANGLSKDQAQLSYPHFEIHESMPEHVRDITCHLADVYSQMDLDAAWEELTGDDAVLSADRVETAMSDLTQDSVQDLKFGEWKMFAEADFLPKKFSKTPVVPEACNSRRRLQLGNARAHMVLAFLAFMAGVLETFFFECTAADSWWPHRGEKCNIAQVTKVTALVFVLEEAGWVAFTEFAGGDPVEGAEAVRDAAREVAEMTGRNVRETENFIPYGISCGYWKCETTTEPPTTTTTTTHPWNDLPIVQDDDRFHSVDFALGSNVPGTNVIDNAPLVPSIDIELGTVNMPGNPFNWGRRKQ